MPAGKGSPPEEVSGRVAEDDGTETTHNESVECLGKVAMIATARGADGARA